jgi:sugar/nucleoside kinase (ribokinase family)
MHDVYLYGMISPSTVHVLDEDFSYPPPNEYAEIKRTYPSVGGEAINSAIMLSKLGLKTKMDGIWINKKHEGKLKELLAPFGIDLSRLTVKDGQYGTEEIVITDSESRTVFGNYASFHAGEKQWNIPHEEDVQHASIVCLDPYHGEESRLVAEMCVRNNIPYVTNDCKYEDYIGQNAAALINSHELWNHAYPGEELDSVFENYLRHCRGLVIFTFGEEELWYARRNEKMKTCRPYTITPLDTAGAGDTFRAGIVYGLYKRMSDEAAVEFASAVAACVCLSIPHALNAPDLAGVQKFMRENKRT